MKGRIFQYLGLRRPSQPKGRSHMMALKYARLRGRDRNAVPEITNAQAATDDARPIFQKAFFNPKSPLDGFATPSIWLTSPTPLLLAT